MPASAAALRCAAARAWSRPTSWVPATLPSLAFSRIAPSGSCRQDKYRSRCCAASTRSTARRSASSTTWGATTSTALFTNLDNPYGPNWPPSSTRCAATASRWAASSSSGSRSRPMMITLACSTDNDPEPSASATWGWAARPVANRTCSLALRAQCVLRSVNQPARLRARSRSARDVPHRTRCKTSRPGCDRFAAEVGLRGAP